MMTAVEMSERDMSRLDIYLRQNKLPSLPIVIGIREGLGMSKKAEEIDTTLL